MAIDPKNLAGTATLTFADEFNTLSLWNGSCGNLGDQLLVCAGQRHDDDRQWRSAMVHQFELRPDVVGEAVDGVQRRAVDHGGEGRSFDQALHQQLRIHVGRHQFVLLVQPDLRLFRDERAAAEGAGLLARLLAVADQRFVAA